MALNTDLLHKSDFWAKLVLMSLLLALKYSLFGHDSISDFLFNLLESQFNIFDCFRRILVALLRPMVLHLLQDFSFSLLSSFEV